MKLGFILCIVLLLHTSNTNSLANEIENRGFIVDFDYKCVLCKWTAQLLIKYHGEGFKPERLFFLISKLCTFFGHMDSQVCSGMINKVGEQLFAILDVSNGTISAKDICGMVLGGGCARKSKRLYDWTLDIPDLDHDPPTSPPVWPKTSNKTHKILHLSDPHVQLDYAIGASTDCGKVICCSSKDPPPKDASKVAGMFGDYACDLPKNTLDLILLHAKTNHPEIEYIFLTGDYPAHDVWRQDRQHNILSSQAIVNSITDKFPNTTVLPALGNHESFPVNMFPDQNDHVPSKYDPSWLYNKLADLYQHWLPDPVQQKTLRDSGYYSVLVQNKLRVVSINANFCNNFNFWLLLNFEDPHRHLHWLYRQLHKAEVQKEKVFILGHIAPGTYSCLGRWSHEYNRIVKRFKNTIAGQFFGHTHFDEFQIFFNDSEAINIAYLAPSETSLDGLNPAYRIYTIDDETNLLLDHETYYFDLKSANQIGHVNIVKEYSARTDLNLEDMSPASWHKYVEKLAQDNNEFQKFWQRLYRKGPAYLQHCEQKCQKKRLCGLLTSQSQLTKIPKVCANLWPDKVYENNLWRLPSWLYNWE